MFYRNPKPGVSSEQRDRRASGKVETLRSLESTTAGDTPQDLRDLLKYHRSWLFALYPTIATKFRDAEVARHLFCPNRGATLTIGHYTADTSPGRLSGSRADVAPHTGGHVVFAGERFSRLIEGRGTSCERLCITSSSKLHKSNAIFHVRGTIFAWTFRHGYVHRYLLYLHSGLLLRTSRESTGKCMK